MNAYLIPIISGIFGGFFGALLSYFNVKRQITAQVVSQNRQAWINDLRNTISKFQSAVFSLTSPSDTEEKTSLLKRTSTECYQLRAKIKLLINPKEDDHRQLIVLLDEIFLITYNEALLMLVKTKFNNEVFNRVLELQNQITKHSQQILKREWERVKLGK